MSTRALIALMLAAILFGAIRADAQSVGGENGIVNMIPSTSGGGGGGGACVQGKLDFTLNCNTIFAGH